MKITWKKITLLIVLSALVFVTYTILSYHSKYPDDEAFLKKTADKASLPSTKTHNQLEVHSRLTDALKMNYSFSTILKKRSFIIKKLLKQGYLAKSPYHKHPLVFHFASGKIGKWVDEKTSIMIPDNKELEIPIKNLKNKVLFLDFFIIAPSISQKKEEKEVQVFLETAGKKNLLLTKKISRYNRYKHKNKPISKDFPLIAGDTGWRHLTLKLPNMNNAKNAQLVFQVKSQSDGISFIGKPVLYTQPPKQEVKKYNVMYVIVDAMSKSYLSVYNPDSGLTPFLNSKKNEFILFEKMYSCGTKTRTFLSGFFTGKSPVDTRHGISFNRYPAKEKKLFYRMENIATLPKVLNKNGYTSIQIGNSGFSSPILETGFNYGFDSSFEFQARPYDTTGIAYHVMKKLQKVKNKPFFLYTHFNTTHSPRKSPLKYYFPALFKYPSHFWRPDMLATTLYTDNIIKQLYNYLKRNKLLEKTILIISSDHGSGHSFNKFYSNYNYDDYINIPFLIRLPESLRKRLKISKKRVKAATTVLNVFPTLLDLLKLPKEKKFSGKSFRNIFSSEKEPPYTDEFIWSYDSFGFSILYKGRWKYIMQLIGGRYHFVKKKYHFFGEQTEEASEQIYDLLKNPDESINLASKNEKLLKIFRQKVLESSYLPEINLLSILPGKNKVKKNIQVVLSTKNARFIKKSFLKPQKGDKIQKTRNGYKVSFTVTDKKKGFIFEINPNRAPLKIAIYQDGKLIPQKRLYTGPYNLNWYKNPVELKKTEDYLPLLMHKKPSMKSNKDELSFHYGRIDLRWWMHFGGKKAQGKIGAEMKEVLKSWGYIQ